MAKNAAELHLRATEWRKAGVNGEFAPSSDETAFAVRSAFRAIRRNPLAPRWADAYSSLIAAMNPKRKDRTMNATYTAPTKTRIAAFAAAVITSTVVLGATVLGMQPGESNADLHVIAMERVVITAPAVN